MATYEIPIVVKVRASSYEEAIKLTEKITIRGNKKKGLSKLAPTIPWHEHDNLGQRVIYLHAEDQPEDMYV
jgi:hypothetical protein